MFCLSLGSPSFCRPPESLDLSCSCRNTPPPPGTELCWAWDMGAPGIFVNRWVDFLDGWLVLHAVAPIQLSCFNKASHHLCVAWLTFRRVYIPAGSRPETFCLPGDTWPGLQTCWGCILGTAKYAANTSCNAHDSAPENHQPKCPVLGGEAAVFPITFLVNVLFFSPKYDPNYQICASVRREKTRRKGSNYLQNYRLSKLWGMNFGKSL